MENESNYFYEVSIKYVIVDGIKHSGERYGYGIYKNEEEIKKMVEVISKEFPEVIIKFKAKRCEFNTASRAFDIIKAAKLMIEFEQLNKKAQDN